MLKRFFAPDPSYKQMTGKYKPKDTLMAVGLYVAFILFCVALGYLRGNTNVSEFYTSVAGYVVLAVICLCMVIFRKDKLSTVGFSFRRFPKALLFGLVTGLILSLYYIIPAIVNDGKLTIDFSPLPWDAVYLLFVIVLPQELIFRGYIQTRLYGAVKFGFLTVLLGGLLYAVMQASLSIFGGGIDWIWLALTILWHILFNFLYRRYNSLTAPVAANWLMLLCAAML
ncbi:MAG: CPBP family intramembrane metalloprotease [Oscillospiraceae bacterium]|nr:CPBP family intramembrane metalloprotease [Oscillospiraceae bacterium]